MTYKEARVYLDEMSKYGSVLGLDTIRGLLRELGNPQDDLKFIHIAGTNGKGSVLAYTSTILSEAGYRTGRYVSPTVISYLERIQIDGTWIPEDEFAELTENVKEAIARMEAAGEESPTVFEAETAIAFLYFKKKKCDLVVLESGLGGILDATNIIGAPVCAAFATISMVVSAKQKENVREILKKTAEEKGCPFTEAQPEQMMIFEDSYHGITLSYKEYEKMHSPLAGQCQRENLATALEVIRCLNRLGYRITEAQVREGLSKTRWTGRFTCLSESPLFFVDGAHNEDAALKLKVTVERYFSDYKKIFIMGVFKDKEYEKITSILCPLAESIYTVSLPNKERTLPAEKLAEVVKKYCQKVKAEQTIETAVEDASKEAMTQGKDIAQKTVILACGSLSYLGEVQRIVLNNRQ